MKEIWSENVKLKKVIVKSGAELYLIELDENHFFIEQNPNKKSKYGQAYKFLKEKYPDFYMFWEIKDNQYTGNVFMGGLFKKQYTDDFIYNILKTKNFMEYDDIKDDIEKFDA